MKQLTQIERRQALIRCIGDRIFYRPHLEIAELARSPDTHHHIGLTQKHAVHIRFFLHGHEGDPAIKVSLMILVQMTSHIPSQNFVTKLKTHLLHQVTESRNIPSADENDISTIILKDDRMYQHNIARFNFTMYDVRRAQDVVNPWTSHCNVMVLSGDNDRESQGHRFVYGKVLGIYHVNIIMIGRGMVDYTPLQMEFLWMRWYKPIDQVFTWNTSTLDRVKFPPLADEHPLDFLDPADVIRGCHIIPSFTSKKKHSRGPGVSACAGDKDDWRDYYVNR